MQYNWPLAISPHNFMGPQEVGYGRKIIQSLKSKSNSLGFSA